MSIDLDFYKTRLITIIDDFLNEKIDAATFCSDITHLWIALRDERSKIKETWDRRYDVEVTQDFIQGKITADEFREKYNELFDLPKFKDLDEVICPLHSLCYCYDPAPELEWEVNELKLRAEVKNIFEKSRLSI